MKAIKAVYDGVHFKPKQPNEDSDGVGIVKYATQYWVTRAVKP